MSNGLFAQEPREWEGSTFDPKVVRVFSFLPDVDDDEGYCVRHEREMDQYDPIIHKDGGLFTTTETFSCYTCAACLLGMATKNEKSLSGILGSFVHGAFGRWDEGNAEGDWFRYLRDGSPQDTEVGFEIGDVKF